MKMNKGMRFDILVLLFFWFNRCYCVGLEHIYSSWEESYVLQLILATLALPLWFWYFEIFICVFLPFNLIVFIAFVRNL